MFGQSRTTVMQDSAAAVKDSALSATQFAAELANSLGTAMRLNPDPKLQRELRKTVASLHKARSRLERKRSHKLRNFLIALGLVGAAAAAAASRKKVRDKLNTLPRDVRFGSRPRALEESIEVNVPTSVAYNQWTQFEDFPLFMEGVEQVQQLDDTRLHWVADVAGRKAEWDAKIIAQHPDRQISWISEDGKKTRGTVTFEPLGPNRTHVAVSMSYQAVGPAEQVGAAAGLDARRVRADLDRFRELVESRGGETGAWRGEVEAGHTTS